ncbi:MAG: UDP-N-acetylmuramoyl-L-alanyl-D-glutamate--2,6-diaminopimelate ligase [Chloroflexi bacterium]|nr:UDP-N-acetylmuramoyl-L-alanyl-D-glutamate--2,6-diaminopimelate ligase [Chloroflexota bacterium]MQC16685.1 UDP-N-acetylmuramoyl-L-alanyl-D-glutamate--2,6-diaminopimelate ligase [Chloroflexota bacterium]MQC48397.1 UDP-N-acetylmuramoyl-L-alanyl-D-glutamate--2,6-diaminopimelate ligase [Chloroflexota bacterium]
MSDLTNSTGDSPRGDWREGLSADIARDALPSVRSIQFDSRQVSPGDLFVCLVGEQADGHDFAGQAVAAGAVALVCDETRSADLVPLGVPTVGVSDPRAALASISAAHEGYPGRALTVVGVTGTDGKSTTAFLIHAALQGCGLKAGLLTTIESKIGDEVVPNPTRLTSQEAPYVQRLLAEMLDAGCTHAVVEATSIGLDLRRLDECYFDAAVFTNLTPDHLDYHGDLQHYRAAKGRLFEMLQPGGHRQDAGVAILNAGDEAWRYFANRTKGRVVTYALVDPELGFTLPRDLEPDVRAEDVMLWPDGSTFALTADEDTVEASVRLPGAFNVLNATAAITTAAALRLDIFGATAGVASLAGVPGRMERIPGAPFPVIVDYAHTADALRSVVETLRPVVDGRIIAVFGCAGERGVERRTGMGGVAAERVDYTILTDEDPRSEPSDAIIDDIAQAMLAKGAVEGERFERIADRREAIARALSVATPGDLVLLAGKGHESTIEYADGARAWDDRAVAREIIAERFGT